MKSTSTSWPNWPPGPADEQLQAAIRAGNTARHALELCQQHGLSGLTAALCRAAAGSLAGFVEGRLEVWTYLIDFDGVLVVRWPETARIEQVSR